MITKTIDAPSNANTSGLGVVAWRRHDVFRKGAYFADRKDTAAMWAEQGLNPEPLVTAASAQARIAELDEQLAQAAMMIIGSLTRADAAEARADRLAKALEDISSGYANCDDFQDAQDVARAALQQETQP